VIEFWHSFYGMPEGLRKTILPPYEDTEQTGKWKINEHGILTLNDVYADLKFRTNEEREKDTTLEVQY
jgi:hypothetical protein